MRFCCCFFCHHSTERDFWAFFWSCFPDALRGFLKLLFLYQIDWLCPECSKVIGKTKRSKNNNLLLFTYFWENLLKNRCIRQNIFHGFTINFTFPFYLGCFLPVGNIIFAVVLGLVQGPNEDLLMNRCWFAGLSTSLLNLRLTLTSASSGPTRQSKVTERQSCIARIVRQYIIHGKYINNGKKSLRTSWRSQWFWAFTQPGSKMYLIISCGTNVPYVDAKHAIQAFPHV